MFIPKLGLKRHFYVLALVTRRVTRDVQNDAHYTLRLSILCRSSFAACRCDARLPRYPPGKAPVFRRFSRFLSDSVPIPFIAKPCKPNDPEVTSCRRAPTAPRRTDHAEILIRFWANMRPRRCQISSLRLPLSRSYKRFKL